VKLDRRIVISALASMIFLSLALRYPETEHELGVDSFFIHNLATNIANDGFAEWILNPLSMFGWYPLSYPSGGPFLLAASSDLGGTSIETTILFLSLAFGAMGVLASFVMAREFRDDDLFCLSVAFIYSFAPRFLAFTLWSASMRGLFMVLLPIFVWSVLRTHREPKPVNFGIVLGLFLLLASTHRLAALLAPGGTIDVLEPNGAFWQQPWLGSPTRPLTIVSEYRNRRHGVTPTLEELSVAAEGAGLAISRVRELVAEPGSTERGSAFAAEFPLWWFFELERRGGG